MNRWNDQPAPREKTQSFAEDMMSLGPASTPGRELAAAALQIMLAYLLVLVVFPDRIPEVVRSLVLIGVPVYFMLRALLGIPKWRCRRR